MTYDMPQLHPGRNSEAMAWLQHDVLAMLYATCAVGSTVQKPARGHVVSNNPLRFSAWPGSDFGVRAPYPSETPLSWDEVQHGVAHGLFDGWDGKANA